MGGERERRGGRGRERERERGGGRGRMVGGDREKRRVKFNGYQRES